MLPWLGTWWLLLPLGRSHCSLSCLWGDANLLALLHAISFFLPSAESQPALLLVSYSQQPPRGQGEPLSLQRTAPWDREGSGHSGRCPAGQPGHRGSSAPLLLFQEAGIPGAPRLSGSSSRQREDHLLSPPPRPLPNSAQASAGLSGGLSPRQAAGPRLSDSGSHPTL